MAFVNDLFDKIRIRREDPAPERPRGPRCQCLGCDQAGEYRAPKGRYQEGEYYFFCLEHVKDYNKSYNYFAGMNDDAVAAFQKDATTGHRPTWTIGVNPWGDKKPGEGAWTGATDDRPPFSAFHARAGRANAASAAPPPKPKRKLRMLEQRAFDELNLAPEATPSEIKARYKALVKRHHPDANGGDRSTEDKLRQIIQAYNLLKSAGFC